MNKCNADAHNKSERQGLHSPAPPRSPPASPQRVVPLSSGRGSLAWPSSGSEHLGGALNKLVAARWLGPVSARKGRAHSGMRPCSSPTALSGRACWVPGMCRALFIHSLLDGCWVVSRFLWGRHLGEELQRSGSLWCLNCLSLIFKPNIVATGYSVCEEAYKVLC